MKFRAWIENITITAGFLATGACLVMYYCEAVNSGQAVIDAAAARSTDSHGSRSLPAELGDNLRMTECPWLDVRTGEFIERPANGTEAENAQQRAEYGSHASTLVTEEP